MSVQPEYAEQFDWLVMRFSDLAAMLVSSYLYYEYIDSGDENTLDIYGKGVSAFWGIAPTYHISLYREKPTIVWDFHSLLRGIQMMFSFALTDETRPLRICKHCNMAYIAERPNSVFCSLKCKNQNNVYKGRDKRKRDVD